VKSPIETCKHGVVALILLTMLVYAPALRNGFIWDDDDHLTANPAMTLPDGLKRIWTSLAFSRYYPLTLTTFWVQRRLWGLNPLPYHAVNIALHGVNAALLFVLLRRLNVRGAWVAAALWAVHPVNVESVAWVTELKNTQSGLFFFLTLLYFFRFEREPRQRWFELSLVCFAAALLSKPSTVMLPLVLLLIVWWRQGRLQRADVVRVWPFFALAFAMSLLTVVEQRRMITAEWAMSVTERLILAGKALWFYAAKLLWPANLTFVYPRWELDAASPAALLPLLAVVAVGLTLWQLRRREWARACLFGLGYFIIVLVPVLGFFDIFFFLYSFVADHFQYLAGLGVIALVTSGAATLLKRKYFQVGASTVAIALLGTLSWQHCAIFHDDQSLWRDTLAKNPRSFMVHNNLGMISMGQKRYEQAAEQFREALRLKADYVKARANLGCVLSELGRYEEALEQFQEAVRLAPDSADAHNNLGVALAMKGSTDEAIAHFSEALRLRPDFEDAAHNLQAALRRQKNPKKSPNARIEVK
jgi:tetratricopeptide (TPR) repeat protein